MKGGESVSCSVVSDSLQPCGLYPIRLLCPRNFPGKNTGVGCHFLLQGIFLTQGSNSGLLHCRPLSEPHVGQGSRNTQKEVKPTALLLASMQLPASPGRPPEGASAPCRYWVFRTFLVVQWLRIHLPIQSTWVQSLSSILKK